MLLPCVIVIMKEDLVGLYGREKGKPLSVGTNTYGYCTVRYNYSTD